MNIRNVGQRLRQCREKVGKRLDDFYYDGHRHLVGATEAINTFIGQQMYTTANKLPAYLFSKVVPPRHVYTLTQDDIDEHERESTLDNWRAIGGTLAVALDAAIVVNAVRYFAGNHAPLPTLGAEIVGIKLLSHAAGMLAMKGLGVRESKEGSDRAFGNI